MRGSLVTANRKCITPHLRQNTSIRFHVPVRVCGVSIEDIEEGNAYVGFPNPGENHRTCQQDCYHTWNLHVHTVSLLAVLPLLFRGRWYPDAYALTAYPALDLRRVA
jgi:hypothetical protein